jgi:uncharacterized repeat protein (TIGR03803 family)
MRLPSLAAAFLTLIAASLPSPAAASGINPHITSVTQVWARSDQTIQISGSGFGSLRPYDGDNAFIEITDLTQNWSAGHTGDAVTLNIGTWSDTLISISYFDGAYGTGNQSLVAGDTVSIQVWNPQTGAGPGKAQVTVLANATSLYTFTFGETATGTPITDEYGNFYGTASGGVSNDYCFTSCGIVYELSPSSGGFSQTTLYEFQGGTDGYAPAGQLVQDASGNLYGITLGSASTSECGLGCGTVFEISGGVKTTLHTFLRGSDGAFPQSGLAMDAAGNLYGTTKYGGPLDAGTVYELTPNGSGGWNYSIIYEFQGGVNGDGAWPYSALTIDSAGNLYGTTFAGGTADHCLLYYQPGCGTIYQLSPSGSGTFVENILYTFKGTSEGVEPTAGVTFDSTGNLYGVTLYGGPPCSSRSRSGCGVAYVLNPQSDGTWREKTIVYFSNNINNVDASTYPTGNLTYYNGIFYGYSQGGASGRGTIYTITPGTGAWSEATIYSFGGPEGLQPVGQPILGSDGVIYGATQFNGVTETSSAMFSLP